MTARWCGLALVAALGCGDDRLPEPVQTGVSGRRLSVVWLGYDDGARQLVPGQLYDRAEHTPCAPTLWRDGVTRCVPLAGDAVYIDAACTEVRGLARLDLEPTHFIGHEREGGVRVAARLYRVGAVTSAISGYFERRDGACVGPLPGGSDLVAYRVGDEVDGASLMPIYRTEVAGDHLTMAVQVSDDGLWLPTELRDRELGLPCTPAVDRDGTTRCRPTRAHHTDWFGDSACTRPVALVDLAAPAPAVVEVVDASGCPTYHRVVGSEPGPFYRRDGNLCRPSPVDPRSVGLATGPALELPALVREVESEPRRRLQRVVIDDGALRFADQRLFGLATGADCEAEDLAGTLRCLPATLAQASTLYGSPSCAVARPVVRLPQALCGQPAFARTAPESPLIGLHAIGDPVTDTLYQAFPGGCSPFAPPVGSLTHDAGPPLDATLFVGGLLFGER